MAYLPATRMGEAAPTTCQLGSSRATGDPVRGSENDAGTSRRIMPTSGLASHAHQMPPATAMTALAAVRRWEPWSFVSIPVQWPAFVTSPRNWPRTWIVLDDRGIFLDRSPASHQGGPYRSQSWSRAVPSSGFASNVPPLS